MSQRGLCEYLRNYTELLYEFLAMNDVTYLEFSSRNFNLHSQCMQWWRIISSSSSICARAGSSLFWFSILWGRIEIKAGESKRHSCQELVQKLGFRSICDRARTVPSLETLRCIPRLVLHLIDVTCLEFTSWSHRGRIFNLHSQYMQYFATSCEVHL